MFVQNLLRHILRPEFRECSNAAFFRDRRNIFRGIDIHNVDSHFIPELGEQRAVIAANVDDQIGRFQP